MKLNFGVIEMFNCNSKVIAQLLLLSITINITLHSVPSITLTIVLVTITITYYYYSRPDCMYTYITHYQWYDPGT